MRQKRKMAIFVAEGYDFNLIIEARNRTKAPPSRGKKISGFWRFMCIRREQLDQAGDDIVHDDLALKDKVAQEWDNLGRKKQQEFKVLAKCVHFYYCNSCPFIFACLLSISGISSQKPEKEF